MSVRDRLRQKVQIVKENEAGRVHQAMVELSNRIIGKLRNMTDEFYLNSLN